MFWRTTLFTTGGGTDERQNQLKVLTQALCNKSDNVTAAGKAATHAQEVTLQFRWAASHAEGCSDKFTLIRASLAAAAAAEEPLGWLARRSSGGKMLERCGAMAGPATSASEPRALQLVEVKVPLSSLGTMVARVWGRTPNMTRKPSSACTYTQDGFKAKGCCV